MNKLVKVAFIAVIVAVIFAVAAVLLQIIWGWVIPDVFAGAVAHGILPASLTFVQALKLNLFLGMYVVGSKGGSKSS